MCKCVRGKTATERIEKADVENQNWPKTLNKCTVPAGIEKIQLMEECFVYDINILGIPGTMKTVDTDAGFRDLEELTFEEGVERIERLGNRKLEKLKKVVLPKSLKYVSAEVFSDYKTTESFLKENGLNFELKDGGFYKV